MERKAQRREHNVKKFFNNLPLTSVYTEFAGNLRYNSSYYPERIHTVLAIEYSKHAGSEYAGFTGIKQFFYRLDNAIQHIDRYREFVRDPRSQTVAAYHFGRDWLKVPVRQVGNKYERDLGTLTMIHELVHVVDDDAEIYLNAGKIQKAERLAYAAEQLISRASALPVLEDMIIQGDSAKLIELRWETMWALFMSIEGYPAPYKDSSGDEEEALLTFDDIRDVRLKLGLRFHADELQRHFLTVASGVGRSDLTLKIPPNLDQEFLSFAFRSASQ